jgi:hypothetical protein
MEKQRVIITISIIAILVIIILLSPHFFPGLPGYHQVYTNISRDSSPDSALVIHNLDTNRSYSVQISLNNATWQNPEKDFLIVPAGNSTQSKILDYLASGNYSTHIIVDGNRSYEYQVTLPSNNLFELHPGGELERKFWIFIE